jgi:hypothetical protein
MKKNVIIALILLSIFTHSTTVFSENASSGPVLNAGVLMLQQQLQAMQMTHSDAAPTDHVDAATVLDTWTGKSPTMKPDGTCTTTTVEVIIAKQCGKLIKGSIKALGVTVPVEGSFTGNILFMYGSKTGTVNRIASIYGSYSAASDNFTVQLFTFQKINPEPDNVYDTDWKLTR